LPVIGVAANPITRSITYRNLTIAGYLQGLDVALRGQSVVDGGRFQNAYDIVVRTAHEANRSVLITGDPAFLPLPSNRSETRLKTNVTLLPILGAHHESVAHVFLPQSTTLDFGPYAQVRLLYEAQRSDFVPWPEPADGVPTEYVGLSNQALWDRFGVALAGKLAPPNVSTLPLIRALAEPRTAG
jgi:hypothetical protein